MYRARYIFSILFLNLFLSSFLLALEREEQPNVSFRTLSMPSDRSMDEAGTASPLYELENIFYRRLTKFIETTENRENSLAYSDMIYSLRKAFESQKAKNRILSFDGGGVRGALSLQLWLLIQQEIIQKLKDGRETADLRSILEKTNEFQGGIDGPATPQNLLSIHGVYEKDGRGILPTPTLIQALVTGTSTGAIAGVSLVVKDPDDPTKPRYTTEETLKFYQDDAPDIFSCWSWDNCLGNLKCQGASFYANVCSYICCGGCCACCYNCWGLWGPKHGNATLKNKFRDRLSYTTPQSKKHVNLKIDTDEQQ